ncbi:MAG: MmcQ/YjbR family DNA-binding protein [Acidimicrobiales bacterium]|nr:MmcQ/YjbR family DNA-binding protein [Acidimicrobiales bacterium]
MTPTFFVRDKKVLCHLWEDHHGDGRLAIWAPAPAGVQADLVEREPQRFFVPRYVGHRGWIGVRLDVDVDWDEIAHIVADAYRIAAPKSLVKLLDDR